MTGTLVAQLAVLSDNLFSAHGVRMRKIGTPIAASLDGMALIVASLGGARYFRQQALLLRKRWVTGGVDMLIIFLLVILVRIELPAKSQPQRLRGM